jgi:hypothetical protein
MLRAHQIRYALVCRVLRQHETTNLGVMGSNPFRCATYPFDFTEQFASSRNSPTVPGVSGTRYVEVGHWRLSLRRLSRGNRPPAPRRNDHTPLFAKLGSAPEHSFAVSWPASRAQDNGRPSHARPIGMRSRRREREQGALVQPQHGQVDFGECRNGEGAGLAPFQDCALDVWSQ